MKHLLLCQVNKYRTKITVLKRFESLFVKHTNLLRFVVRTAHRTTKILVKPLVDASSVKHVSAVQFHRLVSGTVFYKAYGTVGCVTDAYV